MISMTKWKLFNLIMGLTLLTGSMQAYAINSETIEWHNDGGQVFIDKATYTQNTFGVPMCQVNGQKIKTCRLYFTSATQPQLSPSAGVTILSNARMTDTQYAAALTSFTGQKLSLPAEDGLCIFKFFEEQGGGGFERQNCDSGGIKPSERILPTCSVLGGPLLIDFKELNAKDVAGKSLSTNLNILCDANASVKISVIGYTPSTGVTLRSDGSLTANILLRTVSGYLGITESITANSVKSIPVSAELKVNGDLAGGAFSGSAIINIDVI